MPRDQEDFVKTLPFPGGSCTLRILEHPDHASGEASPDVCVFQTEAQVALSSES